MMSEITLYDLISAVAHNKAPRKIEFMGVEFYYYEPENWYYDDTGKDIYHLIVYYDVGSCLLNTVKILQGPWKDIHEIDICNKKDKYLVSKINDIIKNQKYLKERLDNAKDDVLFDYWKDKVESKDVL